MRRKIGKRIGRQEMHKNEYKKCMKRIKWTDSLQKRVRHVLETTEISHKTEFEDKSIANRFVA